MPEADIFYSAKPYWEVARRFNLNKDKSKAIHPTAVRDMERLQRETPSGAARKRINAFLSRYAPLKPTPPDNGPRYA